MDLRDYLRILRAAGPIVLACVVLGSGGRHRPDARHDQGVPGRRPGLRRHVVARPARPTSPTATRSPRTASSPTPASRTAPRSPAPSIKQLHLNLTPQQLSDKITRRRAAEQGPGQPARHRQRPAHGGQAGQRVAAKFNQVVQQTEQTDANGKAVVKLTVIHPATVPDVADQAEQAAQRRTGLRRRTARRRRRGRAARRPRQHGQGARRLRGARRAGAGHGAPRQADHAGCRSPSAATRTARGPRPTGSCGPTCSSSTSTTHRASSP